MSDGFMIDPVKPGDSGSASSSSSSYRPTYNNNSSSSAGKIVLIIFLIIFVFPFLVALVIFLTVWHDIGDEIKAEIQREQSATEIHANDYQLSRIDQARATRFWSHVYAGKAASVSSIFRGDCRNLKNIATSFINQNKTAAKWYDATYCDSQTIGAEADIVTSGDSAGDTMRITLRDVKEKGSCVLLDFTENFQYLTHVSTTPTCGVTEYTIKDDGDNTKEIQPLYTEDSNSGNDDDDDAADDIDHPEEVELPSTQKSSNVLRS